MERPITPGAQSAVSALPDETITSSPTTVIGTHRQPSHRSHRSSRRASAVITEHSHYPEDGVEGVHDATVLPGTVATTTEPVGDEAIVNADATGADAPELARTFSQKSETTMSRGGTLKKRSSLSRSGSKKSLGRKSSLAGSVKSAKAQEARVTYEDTPESNSAFYCPVPTNGNPTELLQSRFQSWRKVLKDIIAYFREVQRTYEARTKALHAQKSIIDGTAIPNDFLRAGGIMEATIALRAVHSSELVEAQKARDLTNDIILQLTGLRSDLQQKLKEIKGLSGDFKNNVDKEMESTRRAVNALEASLRGVNSDSAGSTAGQGKNDPFLVKMGVDRQLERQIEEENYLHRAYLNLEASGRELESIVVGEVQKAFNILTGIMRRDADIAYEGIEKLREGPLAISKDMEWDNFVTSNSRMIDPKKPVRQLEKITYPSKENPAALEVRSGMLERKSKYLKNYTPGWYILSPTHLHEFKSADRISYQSPVMSLFLPEQKLGSHSEPGSSSNKFMLKGRQTGSMHRGHSWVFRAETYDTMMTWFGDVKELTEKRGEDRDAFVRRQHARSASGNSLKAASVKSSEGEMEEDEADKAAFATEASIRGPASLDQTALGAAAVGGAAYDDDNRSEAGWRPPALRPEPGGRFPSDINVARGLQAPNSPSDDGSSDGNRDHDVIAAAGSLPGSGVPFSNTAEDHTDLQSATPRAIHTPPTTSYTTGDHPQVVAGTGGAALEHEKQSNYGDWMTPMGAGAAGGAVVAATATDHHNAVNHEPEGQALVNNTGADTTTAAPTQGLSLAAYGIDATHAAGTVPPPHALNEFTAAKMSDGVSKDLVPGVATVNTTNANSTTSPNSKGGGGPFYDEVTRIPYAGNTTTTTSTTTNTTVGTTTTPVVPTRPANKGGNGTTTTASDLHVPGEYPRTNSSMDSSSR